MDHSNRLLTDHIVAGDSANHQLTIEAVDEPGPGGAHHAYIIALPGACDFQDYTSINFQNGPIGAGGVNGVTHEALLAIILDRLRSFQAGPYASPHNLAAIMHGERMLFSLQNRTRERIARGVEGTHEK